MLLFTYPFIKLTVLSTRSALSVDRDRKLTVLSTRSALSMDRTSMGKVLPGWIGPGGAFF